MRQYYKPLLTLIIIFTLMITGGLLLFGTIDATQVDPLDCEQRIKSECFPRGERPICPNPNIWNNGCDGKDTPKTQPKIECDPGNTPKCPNAIMDRFGRERIPHIQLPDCSMLPTCPLDAAE